MTLSSTPPTHNRLAIDSTEQPAGLESSPNSQPLDSTPIPDAESVHKPQLYDVSETDPADSDRSSTVRQQLSGYNPNEDYLITEEHRFSQDQEETTKRPASEKPTVRFGLVLVVVGGIFGALTLIWSAFFAPKAPTPQLAQAPKPTATPSNAPSSEVQDLKSKLAFQDQKNLVKQAKSAQPAKSTPPNKPINSTPPAQSTHSTNPSIVSTQPTPIQSPAVAAPLPIAPYTPTSPTPTKPVAPVEVDPSVQWRKLAALGQEELNTSTSLDPSPAPSVITQPSPSNADRTANLESPTPKPTSDSTTNPLAPVKIGATPTTATADDETPGEKGILTQTEAVPVQSLDNHSNWTPPPDAIANQSLQWSDQLSITAPDSTVNSSYSTTSVPENQTKTVTLGATAEAIVAVPLVWNDGATAQTSGDHVTNRFAISLSTPLLAADHTTALPAGTIIIFEATAANRSNHLITAQPIAIVYKDNNGNTHQQALPPDSLTIMGENEQPLIGKGVNDIGPDLARQYLLIGLLGGASRAAAVVNQPLTQSNTSINSNGNNQQTTTTTNPRPNILAAALEGFFKPTVDQITNRSNTETQELLQRPNITVVPKDQKASIVVQRPLEINLSSVSQP